MKKQFQEPTMELLQIRTERIASNEDPYALDNNGDLYLSDNEPGWE